MINKYAEINDRVLLYNACKGILRVKIAAGAVPDGLISSINPAHSPSLNAQMQPPQQQPMQQQPMQQQPMQQQQPAPQGVDPNQWQQFQRFQQMMQQFHAPQDDKMQKMQKQWENIQKNPLGTGLGMV